MGEWLLKEEKKSDIKDHMLDYLVVLLDYSNDAAKASHTVLFMYDVTR